MVVNSEKEQLEKRCQEFRNYLNGFQDVVSKSKGELISVVESFSEPDNFSPEPAYFSTHPSFAYSNNKEVLSVGLITPETRFPFLDKAEIIHLLNDVKPLYILNESSGKFFDGGANVFSHSYTGFMDILLNGNFLNQVKLVSGDESLPKDPLNIPSIFFYVGDKASFNFLESNLLGYEYTWLSKLLGKSFPRGEVIQKKIYSETWDLLDKTIQAEAVYKKLLKDKEEMMDLSKGSDFIDSGFVNLNYSVSLPDAKNVFGSLVGEGINRGYDLEGKIQRCDGRGETRTINLGEFYNTRKSELNLKN